MESGDATGEQPGVASHNGPAGASIDSTALLTRLRAYAISGWPAVDLR